MQQASMYVLTYLQSQFCDLSFHLSFNSSLDTINNLYVQLLITRIQEDYRGIFFQIVSQSLVIIFCPSNILALNYEKEKEN